MNYSCHRQTRRIIDARNKFQHRLSHEESVARFHAFNGQFAQFANKVRGIATSRDGV